MIRLNIDIGRDMMERYLKLQTSVFGDFKDIDLSQESMSKLYQIYLKENMMPSVMKEFDVLAQNVKNRPNFVANDNSISIAIASNRIDIIADVSAGDKMPSKDIFIDKAIKYYKEFFEIFDVGVSRMSFISEGIVKIIEKPEEEKLECQYLNTDCLYNKDNIFEWSSNNVSLDEWDINEKKEKVNLNVTMAQRRLNAMKNNQPVIITALVLVQDLNTVAENTSLRLTIDDIACFMNKANEKDTEIDCVMEGR